MDQTMRTDSASTQTAWGPELLASGGARFRLWAPGEDRLTLRLNGQDNAMRKAEGGWFVADVTDAMAGADYAFVLPDGKVVPDPAARALSTDVHGSARLVDPEAYAWQNTGWTGMPWAETILYELHIGTFTPEGTFRAAIDRLEDIRATGITAIEIMPVSHFGGTRGWGYDGVYPYAPHNAYGTPDDLKALIDAAHGLGLMVYLDVVYNHFGPDGNYLSAYAPDFFREGKKTPWGAAIAYDEPAVRDFFVENALYWLREFRLDGLRFDAIDMIFDDAETHVLVEIARRARSEFGSRHIHLVTEDPANHIELRRNDKDETLLYDADWNDDYHHAAHVVATGEKNGYYGKFVDKPVENLARALTQGYIYPGQEIAEMTHPVPMEAFVGFLQNHDQIGNRAFGDRLITLTSKEMLEALVVITMLAPHIPMLFMGEEYGETRPFLFFTDYDGELGKAVREGRRTDMDNFGGLPEGKSVEDVADPNAIETMENTRLDWQKADTQEGQGWRALYRDLIAIRKRSVIPLLVSAPNTLNAGAVLQAEGRLLAIDWQLGDRRLQLRANLGDTPAHLPPATGEMLYGPQTTQDMEPYAVLFALDRA
jgi:malto-oligosyltrehalose trehalohydrolase